MALKATNLALVLAYNGIKSAGHGVRSLCVSSKATLQAGSVKATQLFEIVESLVGHKTVLQSAVGTGTLEVLDRRGWNVRVPFDLVFTPEMRPVISPGDYLAVGVSAPGDSTTIGGSITFEEIGG